MSIINRHNYEEYFLLYIDDELNSAEKQAVEEFVQQHPDLKIELEMLQQSVLHAAPVVFHDKDLLLKNSSSLINEANYEEYFVLYGDDELSNEEKDSVEQFVYRNPRYQAEFELIQKVKLQAESHIVFPDKAILYRTEEENEKVFVMRWWRPAAAVVFVFLSGLGWYMISREKTVPPIVKTIPEKKINQPVPETPQPKQENIAQAEPLTSEIISSETKKAVTKEHRSAMARRSDEKKVRPEMLMVPEKKQNNTKGRNIHIASTVTKEKPEVDILKMETSNNIALKNIKEIIDEEVGSSEPNPLAYTASNDEIEILNTTVSKKNKLRGLFRKVSRVVEKTTNIETGDGRGIRIANFEIALK
jgi:hypothetical protein